MVTGRVLAVTDTGDGAATLHVDVAVDTLAVVMVPAWVALAGDAPAVAEVAAARYAARRRTLKGEGT